MFQQSTAKYLQVCKCYHPTSIVRVNPRYKRSLVSSEASKALAFISTRILYILSLDKIVTHVTRATGLNLRLPVKLTSIIFLGKQTPYCHKFITNCKNGFDHFFLLSGLFREPGVRIFFTVLLLGVSLTNDSIFSITGVFDFREFWRLKCPFYA